ncbi:MAG: DoxX family protein [Pseudomonadales bacterium]|nr:DoxX family protein [Pseudomonadales bacterium]
MFYLPNNKVLLGISVILALAFLAFGGMKFASPQQLLDNFAAWGYPSGFHYLVGLAEVAGAIGLFIRPLARYAALGLGLLMVGAFMTHVLHPPLSAGVPSFLLGAFSFVAASMHFKAGGAQDSAA